MYLLEEGLHEGRREVDDEVVDPLLPERYQVGPDVFAGELEDLDIVGSDGSAMQQVQYHRRRQVTCAQSQS